MPYGRFLALILLLPTPPIRGQDVLPPPKPPDVPSLEVTMKYLEDRLNQVDSRFVKTQDVGNAKVQTRVKYRVSDATTDTSGCFLSFQTVRDIQGDDDHLRIELQTRLSLREVAALVVDSYAAYLGRKGYSSEFVPEVYILRVKMALGNTATVHTHVTNGDKMETSDERDEEAWVLFLDEEIAKRVAKAMVNAVELCGGGDKDPFK
jgi:hypothetical protein